MRNRIYFSLALAYIFLFRADAYGQSISYQKDLSIEELRSRAADYNEEAVLALGLRNDSAAAAQASIAHLN